MSFGWISVGAAAAFMTGLGGSGHCALMCGPLACAGLGAGERRRRRLTAFAWHTGRLGAYVVLGGVLGAVGSLARIGLPVRAMRALPWLMAAGLLLSAFEIGRRAPPIPGIARIPRTLALLGAKFSGATRAAVRGAATPFLPCGLLYGAFLTAAAAGGVLGGAVVMGGFGLGAIPALALAQSGLGRLAAYPRAYALTRRAVPIGAAAVLVWRALLAGDTSVPPHCH